MQKIFIVEDSPLLQERIAALIAGLPGTRVVGHAASAAQALAGIARERPDVVLLDLCLHKSSGFDVLRALHESAPGIDVYVLTSFATEPYRRHAGRLGARGFFDKSTEFERMRDVIAERAVQVH
jgi:DNA-binding NarL/FixJ family response regulator